MKKIIIYTTEDKIISLHLVNRIISEKIFKDYEFHILLSKPKLVRKLKILLVLIIFGSIKTFIKNLFNPISITQILSKNLNCKIINVVDKKIDYDFGLSVYCSSKIQLQKFKIYNFHLGNLHNQRGSFIFFYKFLYDWKDISLTFHEISDRFDVGKVINQRKIILEKKCKATDIFFSYLKNQDFLIESINKIGNESGILNKKFEKLNLVPSILDLLRNMFKIFLKKF